jgi:hypothetical protein
LVGEVAALIGALSVLVLAIIGFFDLLSRYGVHLPW